MRLESLRWPLFAAAVLLGLKILFRYDPVSLSLGLACAACWYVLSRRKAWSLDRDRLSR
ncbi:MAG: hypothetical protein SF051_04990 [Elusimicrobiota bacterium]|nr:hypothetical protein [Elusimicrobiota bacterium]